MMGTKERSFAALCNRSLEELVPPDSFYRRLEARRNLDFVRDLVRASCYTLSPCECRDVQVDLAGGICQQRADDDICSANEDKPYDLAVPGR